MLNASIESHREIEPNQVTTAWRQTDVATVPSLATDHAESILASWLEKLLQHFSLKQLDGLSEQALLSHLARCGESSSQALQGHELLHELRRRIIRLAGAQLGNTFVSMAPDVIDEDVLEHAFLSVAGRQLEGLRYGGEVYRLVEAFQPCHRLQAYCLAQTLNEQTTSYVMTRSAERFAVWVNVSALPKRYFSA
ncbi:MAG: hypothetical protein AAFQ74_18085 [Cyanobacteria bacterium J06623_4]